MRTHGLELAGRVSDWAVRGLDIKVAGDRRAPAFVPDKSGKPRQAQLGY